MEVDYRRFHFQSSIPFLHLELGCAVIREFVLQASWRQAELSVLSLGHGVWREVLRSLVAPLTQASRRRICCYELGELQRERNCGGQTLACI
jgi:hypothetical protein